MARPTMKLYNKLLGTLAVGIGSVWALENTTVYEFESVKGLFEQDYRSVFSDNGSRVQLRDAVVMNGTVVYEAPRRRLEQRAAGGLVAGAAERLR